MPIVKFDSLEFVETGILKNVRKIFDPIQMDKLLNDIAENGLTQAPSVRRKKQDITKFEIICGERRCRCISKLLEANKECWHKTKQCRLPAREVYSEFYVDVRMDLDDDVDAAIVAIGENEIRVNLSEIELIERVQLYEDMLDGHGNKIFSRKKIAEIMRKPESWVSQSLSLMALPDIALKAISDGLFDRSAGIQLLKLHKSHPHKMADVIEHAKKQVQNGLNEQIQEIQNEIEEIEQEQVEVEQKIAQLNEKIESIPVYETKAVDQTIKEIEKTEEIRDAKLEEGKRAKERFEKLNKGKNSRQITTETLLESASKLGALDKNNPLSMKKVKAIKKDLGEAINDEFYSDKVRELTIMYVTLDFVLGNVKEDEIVNILDLVDERSKKIRSLEE